MQQARRQITVGLERMMVRAANALWPHTRRLAARPAQSAVKPAWAPAPYLGQSQRTSPPLGWPRSTDSLCPQCVKELREKVLAGELSVEELIAGHHAEIPARIHVEGGKVLMSKHCERHGACEDVISIDPDFLRRIESLFPGRDHETAPTSLRRHGTSTIKYGRGAVLTVDLTNRCNMMCDPCFMDANQVGFVHELAWEDVSKILDDSLSVKPRRQMSVQFSGGEPTLSPHFLRAVAHARDKGYISVQAASNGIRFAQDPEFCRQAKAAGLRIVYLQFDGVGNAANSHRKVGNLFDVKLHAIQNLAAAGIDVVLVVTVVNGMNNDQVGPVVQFAIDNADKITVVSFQPVAFTGRDEDISDSERARQRYTLSHLVHDLKSQLGYFEPMRDWFPLSAMNPFSDLVDVKQGPDADWGALKCGCHPNCGVGTALLVHKRTKQAVPVASFVDVEQLIVDLQQVADAGRSPKWTMAQAGLAVLRNFRPEKAPAGFDALQFARQLISQIGARGDRVGSHAEDAKEFEWRFLFVAGMWFQDLFNYDFRRTEMCIIPYGTQMGEISFCAYNSGIGWRQIVEKMHQTASTAQWYSQHGRHPVYARHQDLSLPNTALDLVLREQPDGRRRLRLVS